ncbi:MAG: tRNA (adenosine(37)-N6)-dimethylallyltransferase MiaA, partial [Fidelibacterota bacterium]
MNWTGGLSDPDSDTTGVLVIVGPTAMGKSSVAVAVATDLGGEIISLDSRQIYRRMTVGTAQPTKSQQGGIPHHLYQIKEPGQSISAGEFAHLAREKIAHILGRGRRPVVCGGSGLYYRALTRGLFEGSRSDPLIRQRLRRELEKSGQEALLERLGEIDPDYARIVHPNNHRRLLRALEIYEITGIPPSEHFRRQKESHFPYPLFTAYLRGSLRLIEERIRVRTGEMLDSGWIEEVKDLLDKGYGRESHPMNSLGYGQIMDYLDGRIDYD